MAVSRCYREVTYSLLNGHFSSVLWPLARDLWQINCSFIDLALNIHIFSLHPEAVGNSAHMQQEVCIWSPLRTSEFLTKVNTVVILTHFGYVDFIPFHISGEFPWRLLFFTCDA